MTTENTVDGIMHLSISDFTNEELNAQLQKKVHETIDACVNPKEAAPQKPKKIQTQSCMGAKLANHYRCRHTPEKAPIFSGVHFPEEDTLRKKIEELEDELSITKNELAVTNQKVKEQASLIHFMNTDMKEIKSKMIEFEKNMYGSVDDLNEDDSFIQGLPSQIGGGDHDVRGDILGDLSFDGTGVSAAEFAGKILRNSEEISAAKKIQNAWKQSNKKRFVWCKTLHEMYMSAVDELGGPHKCTASDIMKKMEEIAVKKCVTFTIKKEQIASHLQRHRDGKFSPAENGKHDQDACKITEIDLTGANGIDGNGFFTEEEFDHDKTMEYETQTLEEAGYFAPHNVKTCFECKRSNHTNHWRKNKDEVKDEVKDWCNACAVRAKRKGGIWTNVQKRTKTFM